MFTLIILDQSTPDEEGRPVSAATGVGVGEKTFCKILCLLFARRKAGAVAPGLGGAADVSRLIIDIRSACNAQKSKNSPETRVRRRSSAVDSVFLHNQADSTLSTHHVRTQ